MLIWIKKIAGPPSGLLVSRLRTARPAGDLRMALTGKSGAPRHADLRTFGKNSTAVGGANLAPCRTGTSRFEEVTLNKFIVVVFPGETQAYQTSRALRELHAEGSLTLYGMAVVAKDPQGNVSIKESADAGAMARRCMI